MPRRERWYDAIEAVTADIACDGSTHRISWRRGKLVLHDHVLRDEEVLLSLGSTPAPCVATLLAWRDRRGWAAATRPHPPGFVRRMPPPIATPALAAIRSLTVVRAWERQWRRREAVEDAESLYQLLRRRAVTQLQAALDAARIERGGGRAGYVEVRMREAGAEEVEGRIEPTRSYLVVTLSPRWLYEVDPRGSLTDSREFRVDARRVVGWEICDAGWRATLRSADENG